MSFSVGYGPYGEAYGTSGTADLSFTGQNQDMVTTYGGLYDFLYREYNPNQGRWVSPDPSGLGAVAPGDPQTWNRYAYVANNPLSNTDPQGLDCFIDGCGWWGMFPGGGGFPYPFLGYLPPQLLYGGGIGNGYGSGFDFNLDGDLGGMGSCGGENLGMPCGMLPLATSPGQALQSLWADAFGLPTFDCPTSQGPWCNGQSPVSPIMDAFNPWQQQCTNDAYELCPIHECREPEICDWLEIGLAWSLGSWLYQRCRTDRYEYSSSYRTE